MFHPHLQTNLRAATDSFFKANVKSTRLKKYHFVVVVVSWCQVAP